MTQQEIVHAIRQELPRGRTAARTSPQASPRTSPRSSSRTPGQKSTTISQSYLSQIENGSRPHMTQSSRALLARFFKVHPGFLVDDPDGYHTELTSDLRTTEGKLDVWLLQGSERFAGDPEISDVLIKCAREKDTRRCLILLGAILETPGLAERLLDALRPELASRNPGQDRAGRESHARENHGRASGEGRRIR
jgi:transcriptional regulator with XRE-family HTH domain